MAGRTVELRVAGQSCRVVTTADDDELRRLAGMVEAKLGPLVTPGRPLTTQAVLLAAIALAHDVDAQKSRADSIRAHARNAIDGLLARIDSALGSMLPASTPAAATPARRRGDGDGAGGRQLVAHNDTTTATVLRARRVPDVARELDSSLGGPTGRASPPPASSLGGPTGRADSTTE